MADHRYIQSITVQRFGHNCAQRLGLENIP